jgi:uncharacterized protein (DUF4415 family)
MNVKLKNIKSNLKENDAHLIAPEEYEELPEITDEMFSQAVYKVNGIEKVAPRRRGRQKMPTKIALNLRLPLEVVDYFKRKGPGWQTTIGNVLKDWVKSHQ